MPKYFQVSVGKCPNKHILMLSHAKHRTLFFFHIAKAANWVLQFLKSKRKTFLVS